MSEFKGTPGPWRVDDEHDLDRIEIVGRPDYPCSRFGEQGEWRVAEIDDLMGDFPAIVAANARLIAAAPDLLEALECLVEVHGNLECSESEYRAALNEARNAIKKALQS